MRSGWPTLVGATLCTCTAPPSGPVRTSSSSTIVLSADEQSLWLTSPDDDALVQIATTTLSEEARVALPGAPEQLAWVGAVLVVTFTQSTRVAIVDPATHAVRWVDVPCGGTQAVAAASATGNPTAVVTCPNDDRVIEIDVTRASVLHEIDDVTGRPTAIAVADDVAFVSASSIGAVRSLWLPALNAASSMNVSAATLQREAQSLVSTRGFAATQTDALAVDPSTGTLVGTYQRVDLDAHRDLAPDQGGYGSVLAGAPRIEPRVYAPCGGRYAVFDGGLNVFSGPSAIAYAPSTQTLWVAHRYTDNVATLRCTPGQGGADASVALSSRHAATEDDRMLANRATFRTGRGPRGIAVNAAGTLAYVDVGFDHAVDVLAAPDATRATPSLDPMLALRRPLGTTALSVPAMAGRSLFHDAVNIHLTPSGIVTCATCHPAGGDDGQSWFLHTANVPRKFRRTPPAWGGRTSLAPFHWDGGFTDVTSLTTLTLHELMGGDGLLVDTGALMAWMNEMPLPPACPLGATEQASALRGQALFADATVGCASCHVGPLFADGRSHSVVLPSTDPDGALANVDTPSLVGVRARAPYLHDGRATTLRAVVVDHNPGDTHGRTSQLTPSQVDDLVVYLTSL